MMIVGQAETMATLTLDFPKAHFFWEGRENGQHFSRLVFRSITSTYSSDDVLIIFSDQI